MRTVSLYIASLFALSVVACGGQVADVGGNSSGGAYVGAGGAFAIQPNIGGALTVPASTTTGGTRAINSSVAAGGTTVYYTSPASAGTTGFVIAAAGGAANVNGVVVNNFDTPSQVQLFTLNTFTNTDCSVNVAAPNDAGSSTQVGWSGNVDANVDSTSPGSMKLTTTFTNWNQYVEVSMYGPADSNGNPIDLTNKLVTAEVKVTQGISPTASYPFGAVVFVMTGSDYVWGASSWMNIESTGSWYTLTLDTNHPQGVPAGQTFDPTQPKLLGIQLSTGGGGESTYCAQDYGANFGPPQITMFYVNDIQIEP